MLNYVKFRRGTKQEYEALLQKDSDTLYFIVNPGESNGSLYLGTQLISGGTSIPEGTLNLSNLKDINLTEPKNDDVLSYDSQSQKWVNKPAKGSEPQVTILENPEKLAHDALIRNNMAEVASKKGDIVIIKDLIVEGNYQHTAYIYNNGNWQAMNGNYNAKNVYFDKDFTFTTNVGTVVVDSTGSKKVDAAGKNVAEFIEKLFSSPKDPKVTQPSVSIKMPKAGKYEVGTTVTPSYEATFNAGSYEFDTSTGVTVSSWEISDTNKQSASAASGSLAEITVDDKTNYYITAKANYGDGSAPKNNLGTSRDELKIVAGSKTATSGTITGYRSFFYGLDKSNAEIDSAFVRKLKNGGNSAGSHDISFSASELVGVTRFVIAVPTDSKLKVSKATITTSMNADATKDYHKQEATVQVEGANKATAVSYDIWTYAPASIAATEKHTVKLS